jgi:hypothetical protein
MEPTFFFAIRFAMSCAVLPNPEIIVTTSFSDIISLTELTVTLLP